MKRFLPVLLLTVSLVSSLAFSCSAVEGKPNPVVTPATDWLQSNSYVHVGQNSASVNAEGVGIVAQYISNNFFDNVYFNSSTFEFDPYVSAGYYHGGYSYVATSGWLSSSNFMGGPYIYLLFEEGRVLQPGQAVEFYVYVGNVNLRAITTNETYYFNYIGGIRVGNCSPSVNYQGPYSFSEISGLYSYVNYQLAKNYGTAVDQRYVQMVHIENHSNEPVSFNGIQLVFGHSDINGTPIPQNVYGFNAFYCVLSFSNFLLYNTTTRDQSYLDEIGGTLGTIDDKFDSMNGSLGNLDNILDNWNNATWQGTFNPNLSYEESEEKALADFVALKNQFVDNMAQMNLLDGAGFWQSIYSMLVGGAPYIGLLAALSGVLIATKALLGR